jgi:hypothetical protein
MNTENIVAHARARFDHAAAKLVLKEKYQAKMLFAYNGGMFQAGPELQSTVLSCPGIEAVILDLYGNPVKIETRELLSISQTRWQEQMNAWLVEYNELSNKR